MSSAASEAGDLLDRVLSSGPPTVLYQPVVDLTLATTPVVGYEALARWPELAGTSTDRLFAEAERHGRVAELDWACRSAAVRGALDAGIDHDTALFVNVEPVASVQRTPPEARSLWRSAADRLTMVLEVTERKILTDASALLTAITQAREVGWWIAVDDVGVNPESLAMLEFIRPDMVKLDLGFVQRPIDADAARTLRGVSAYCERTGAALVAEGIETEEQLERALGVGATLGQGYLFGRPGRLHPAASPFRARRVSTLPVAETPYRLLAERRGYRIARQAVLMKIADDIERMVLDLIDPPVLLTSMHPEPPESARWLRRQSGYAPHSPLVVTFGPGMPAEPAAGVRGTAVAVDDPLADEWAVVVLGTHGAVALAARAVDGDGIDGDRRFRYVMTQDRDLVVAAGVSLLKRLVQAPVG